MSTDPITREKIVEQLLDAVKSIKTPGEAMYAAFWTILTEAIAAALRELREQLVSSEDWDALLFEISKLYALIDDEWEDADISNMEEFDPWEALRKIKPRITAGAATAEPTSVVPETRLSMWSLWKRR